MAEAFDPADNWVASDGVDIAAWEVGRGSHRNLGEARLAVAEELHNSTVSIQVLVGSAECFAQTPMT